MPSSWGHQPPRCRGICFQLARWCLRRSHPMTLEVVGPAAQHRVELAQQVLQWLFVHCLVIVLTLVLIEVSDRFATQV